MPGPSLYKEDYLIASLNDTMNRCQITVLWMFPKTRNWNLDIQVQLYYSNHLLQSCHLI